MGNTLRAYEHVRGIYFPIAVGVFVLVVGALLVLLVRGARRTVPGRGSQALLVEVVYACVLACVAGFLVWATFTAETPIDRTVADPGLRLKAIAAQWSWRFVYSDGVSVADIDTWHPTPAYLPTGTEIEITGTSEDVIHGFWIPALHYQRQFVPGYATHFNLLFQKPGYYVGACSVLCGLNHSEMHFAVRAVSPQSFHTWLNEQHAHGGGSS
ncbi:MAG TPA: cytochrome c oxidase subunit II [Solirubrobacteraceae bacterium]|nr:cytochrome c oxidase subunit II [Solirubrobacteraceae bacterium]